MEAEKLLQNIVPPLRVGEASELVRHCVKFSQVYKDENRRNVFLRHHSRIERPDVIMCFEELLDIRGDLLELGTDELGRPSSVSMLVSVVRGK